MMHEYFCFDISFPSVDFDSYEQGYEKVKSIHHAHLYSRENEIEIRILFEPNTYFGRKFSMWVASINWRKFGAYVATANETQNPRLQKLDLSDSALMSVKSGQQEGNLEYVSITIDSAKFHWPPESERLNTADFILNDAGFSIVKQFYAVLWPSDDEGQFRINRMDGRHEFYPLVNSRFRPEFDFSTQDDKSSAEATIVKEPKIHFNGLDQLNEDEIVKYGDIVRLMASFYSRTNIDYTITRIYLGNVTIAAKKIQGPTLPIPQGGLWEVGLNWHFDEFMKSGWQESALKNYLKLRVVVPLFNQSVVVGGSSGFLIRFNILELCKGGVSTADRKFKFIKSDTEVKKSFEQALNLLLEIVKVEDQEPFRNKWQGIIQKLQFKPMKSPIKEFLIQQKLPVDSFPLEIGRLIKIRNGLTHGSIEEISVDELEKANNLMYGIAGVLILNLLGIKDWKLNTT